MRADQVEPFLEKLENIAKAIDKTSVGNNSIVQSIERLANIISNNRYTPYTPIDNNHRSNNNVSISIHINRERYSDDWRRYWNYYYWNYYYPYYITEE